MLSITEMKRFEPHAHTEYSNIRLLDCINKPKKLVERAREIGLSGITITDHECLSSAIELNILQQKIQKEDPSFKIAIGNEIYLTNTRNKNQKYFHFILIAKNKTGFKILSELSSKSWMQSYTDRGMERVPTLKTELKEVIQKYGKGNLIATSACLGGELSTLCLALDKTTMLGNNRDVVKIINDFIKDYIDYCKDLFGEDFYIECAPGCSKEQIIVNKYLKQVSSYYNIPMIIGTDAHYLKKEDRYVHKAYLNSQDGQREVDDFYEYSYLQEEQEIYTNLAKSDFSADFIFEMIMNSYLIYQKIENYSLLRNQQIPTAKIPIGYKYEGLPQDKFYKYSTLANLEVSEDKYDRYWLSECLKGLNNKNLYDKEEYWERLEEEARVKKKVGDALGTNMLSYPTTLQHYIDLFWECGSMVGAGRGSSCAALNHYLLDVTQLDPIKWDLPFFRYLNEERLELGDIDLDLCPSKRPLIIQKIKEERKEYFNDSVDELSKNNLGCTMIATFGTESTKSAILSACRGYRSPDYPNGIDVDVAQYISSLIEQERGFLFTLSDTVYGNKEKNRKPNSVFLKEVSNYPGLLDIMFGIEGLKNKRSSHASGVIMFEDDPYEKCCFMRTPGGEIITQFDLHMAEAAGNTKFDFLVTDVQDKLVQCIELLQQEGEIEKDLSLREVYNKYFHPLVLDIENPQIWENLKNGSIINVFQFDSPVGGQAAKKIAPKNIRELSDANGLSISPNIFFC